MEESGSGHGIGDGNLDVSQRGIQDGPDSFPKNRSNSLFSFVRQGLGFESPNPTESSILPLSDENSQDAVVMKADLLISNPYMNTTEKFDELKELETQLNRGRSTSESAEGNSDSGNINWEYIPPIEMIRLRSAQALGLAPILEENEGQVGQEHSQPLFNPENSNLNEIASTSNTPRRNIPDLQFPSSPSPIKIDLPDPPLTSSSSNKHDLGLDDVADSVSRDSDDNSSLREQTSRYVLNMESKLRDLNIPMKIRQNTQIYEMDSESKLTYSDLTFDSLYSKLKKECKYGDIQRGELSSSSHLPTSSSTPTTSVTTIHSKYHKYRKQSYINGDLRMTLSLFGTGRIDGTKDFVRFNFPINLEDIYDPLHLSFENTLGAYKSTLFLRRHSIWFSFYTEAYPIQAIIMARKLILFLPKSKESVLALNDSFVKEIVPQIQQVIEGLFTALILPLLSFYYTLSLFLSLSLSLSLSLCLTLRLASKHQRA
jgi:hypothetical protein